MFLELTVVVLAKLLSECCILIFFIQNFQLSITVTANKLECCVCRQRANSSVIYTPDSNEADNVVVTEDRKVSSVCKLDITVSFVVSFVASLC